MLKGVLTVRITGRWCRKFLSTFCTNVPSLSPTKCWIPTGKNLRADVAWFSQPVSDSVRLKKLSIIMKISPESYKSKPCPCGSNKKSEDCCLLSNDEWYKQPCKITSSPHPTGISNDKCYISLYRDCSKEISKEHYVSHSILRHIGTIIEVKGFPWQKSDVINIPTACLGSKVLCKKHNEGLSCLDSEAFRFFQVIKKLGSFETQDNFFLFNGNDIERWMLKILYGLIASKNLRKDNGTPIYSNINTKCLDLLFGKIPHKDKRGLFIRSGLGHTISHSSSISVSCITNIVQRNIQGIHVNIRGFDFLLSTTPINAEDSVYRPKQIIFNKNGNKKVIEFTWDDPTCNKIVLFNWKGKNRPQ